MPASIDVPALDTVVARLPQLVLDPGSIVGVMEEISKAAGSEGSALFQSDVRTPDVPHTPGIADLFNKYFAEGWHTRDLRVRAIPKMLRTGIGVDQDFASSETFRREGFYNELLRPMGFQWWAGIAMPVGETIWCLALQRTPRQGLFDERQQAILARLATPLTQAANLSAAVGKVRLAGMSDGLNLVSQPAIVLDRHGRVLNFNQATESLFGKGISVAQRMLTTADPRANIELAKLGENIAASLPSLATVYKPIVVRRRNTPVLLLRALPLPRELCETFTGARAMLLIQDLARRARVSVAGLAQTVYRLTPAEARLAEQLAQGATVRQAADTLGVTFATARNQLAAAMAKLDVHRQSELVALFATLVPAFT
jgi:DNA-binding CsgD family transcriptional regulator/PAS domain-containing protein